MLPIKWMVDYLEALMFWVVPSSYFLCLCWLRDLFYSVIGDGGA